MLPPELELLRARKVLGWPKRCKLAHAFLWEHSARKGCSWPNFWDNLAAFSLGPPDGCDDGGGVDVAAFILDEYLGPSLGNAKVNAIAFLHQLCKPVCYAVIGA